MRGYDPQLVQSGSAASVPRVCATPEDISMDTSRLQVGLTVLGVEAYFRARPGVVLFDSDRWPARGQGFLPQPEGQLIRCARKPAVCGKVGCCAVHPCCPSNPQGNLLTWRSATLQPAARISQAVLGVRPTPFEDALRQIFQ